MNDFETRLTEALRTGAEQAPDVDGLAAGARTRAHTRRRTRVAVGIGAVVAALAAPVGVLALDGDDNPDRNRIATDVIEDEPAGWHTVEHEGVLVDVPPDWGRLNTTGCEFELVRFGPPGSDPCGYDGQSLNFYGSATFDPANGPGLRAEDERWAGYVYTGDWAVYAMVDDQDRARRILGSAREEGQQAPDLSAGFRTETYNGMSIDVPADWREGTLRAWCVDDAVPGWVERPDTVEPDVDCPTPQNYYGIRFGAGRSGDWIRERSGPEYPEGSWAGVAIAPSGNRNLLGIVQVVAPTQGLAELIGGSLRAD